MKLHAKLFSRLAILILAAIALFYGTGCNMDPFAYAVGYDPDDAPRYFIIRCDPSTKQLELRDDNFHLIGSPINGMPCSVSTELQGRPLTISQAVSHGLITTSGSAHPNVAKPDRFATSSSAATALTNTFSLLMPLLFPPAFPTADNGKVTPTCPSDLGFYVVNHLQGTVTSVGMCPSLHVLKTITVVSDPLQAALTPDGSMLLVTSYDSAVNFIDTGSDTVTFTLPTPNYYPSGIAISPDGTRAYVTNYFDTNPALLVIDIPNRKLLSAIALQFAYPRAVALTPDGQQAWVNYYQGRQVTIVDTVSGTISRNLNLGVSVSTGMVFNPTGTKAYIATYPSSLYVVDTASLSILTHISVGMNPNDVIALADGTKVFVDSETQDGAWVIDTVHDTLLSAPNTSPNAGGTMGMMVYH